MHWHILGAGAMGCLWAHYLAQADHQVTLIRRKPCNKQVEVQLECNQVLSSTTLHCTNAPPRHSMDYLLVTTKATDTVGAVLSHRDALKPQTRIVLLQNGMGQHHALAAALPGMAIYAALSTDGAWLRQPLHAVHAGHGSTRIGGITASASSEQLMPVLQDVALPTEWVCDIDTALWLKLAINCAINGLTAIYRCNNGALLDHGARQQRMQRLCQEVEQLMHAEGITLPDGTNTYQQAIHTAQATAHNRSSTLQDVLAGRNTELDALNGFVVRQSRRHDLATPENAAVLAELATLLQPRT